jgi:hypothetical protein
MCHECAAHSTSNSGQEECQCEPGYSGSGVACVYCTAGKYKTTIGPDDCTDCAAGKYSSTEADSDPSACVDCPAGKYSAIVGAYFEDVCMDCPPGTYHAENMGGATSAAVCVHCAAGKFASISGATDESACIGCAAGTASVTVGANDLSTCSVCPANTYSSMSSAICTPCPLASTSPAGSTGEDACHFSESFMYNLLRTEYVVAAARVKMAAAPFKSARDALSGAISSYSESLFEAGGAPPQASTTSQKAGGAPGTSGDTQGGQTKMPGDGQGTVQGKTENGAASPASSSSWGDGHFTQMGVPASAGDKEASRGRDSSAGNKGRDVEASRGLVGLQMQATVPAGMKGSEVMQVHTPSGEVLEVVIPVGLLAGQSFQFDLRGSQTAGEMAGEKRKGEYIQSHGLDVGLKMQATVPAGKKGGEVMQVHTPSGEVLEVLIPVGLLAGQSFQFDLPGGKQPGSLETNYKNQIQTAGEMAGEKRKSEYIQIHNLDVADVGHKVAEDVMVRGDQQQQQQKQQQKQQQQKQQQDLWFAKQKEAHKLMDTLKAEDAKKEAAEEEAKKEAGAEAVEVVAERKDLLESALKIIYAQEAKKAAAEQEAQRSATWQALALNPKP